MILSDFQLLDVENTSISERLSTSISTPLKKVSPRTQQTS
jgi:hypothetical protein